MVGSEVSARDKCSELKKIERDFARIKDVKREILILVEDAAKDDIKKRYVKDVEQLWFDVKKTCCLTWKIPLFITI